MARRKYIEIHDNDIYARPSPYTPRNANIDLGLAVLGTIQKRGHALPHRAIAEVCECSPAMIQNIELSARKKFYRRMKNIVDK